MTLWTNCIYRTDTLQWKAGCVEGCSMKEGELFYIYFEIRQQTQKMIINNSQGTPLKTQFTEGDTYLQSLVRNCLNPSYCRPIQVVNGWSVVRSMPLQSTYNLSRTQSRRACLGYVMTLSLFWYIVQLGAVLNRRKSSIPKNTNPISKCIQTKVHDKEK